jgi:hypothetical protein
LRGWAKEIETTAAGTRWSFCRDIDGVRALFLDSPKPFSFFTT